MPGESRAGEEREKLGLILVVDLTIDPMVGHEDDPSPGKDEES